MGAYKKFKKVVKRTATKRYTKGARGKRTLNLKKIGQDVMMLKNLVNVEKKRVDLFTATALAVGQLAGAGITGANCTQITPVIAQGITNSTRNGNSVKLTSLYLSMQYAQQANTINDIKLRYYIICRPDNAALYAPAAITQQFLEANPFSSVQDFYSSRDPEYFGAFRVIKRGTVNLKQDQITSGQSIVQINVPLKLNYHLKYNSNASTDTVKNNLYLLVVCSGGDTTLLTGASLAYNARYYFTDN